MSWYVAGVAAIIGAIIGSFLTVVSSRVPDGLSIVSPRSQCPSCGTPISGRDNIPVIAYVLRRGRCRSCNATISPRYPATELATALLFAALAARISALAFLPAYCVLAAGLVALTVVDLERLRLPTPIILWTGAIGLPLLVIAAVIHDEASGLVRVPVAAAVVGAVFALIYLAVPRGFGLGDVRLAVLCGAFLGFLGYRVAAVAVLLAFVSAGALGVLLLATKKAGRRSRIPFGPFIALGTMLGVLFGSTIAHAWLG